VNVVIIQGMLRHTSSLDGQREWIWLHVGGQWLPVLCDERTTAAVSKYSDGTEVRIRGRLEYRATGPNTWALRVVATKIKNMKQRLSPSMMCEPNQARAPRASTGDWVEEEYEEYVDYRDIDAICPQIADGVYWDPIEHECFGPGLRALESGEPYCPYPLYDASADKEPFD
jgi:hypothetical protein